jgi:hypothetical protein
MVEKDNYATMSPLNEGAGGSNTYMSNTPFGNIKIYDLDAEIQPIQRMQFGDIMRSMPKNVGISEVSAMEIPQIERMSIVPNVPNLANMDTYYKSLPTNVAISESQDSTTSTSTIAPITTSKKPNYLVYGGGALVVALLAYNFYKK